MPDSQTSTADALPTAKVEPLISPVTEASRLVAEALSTVSAKQLGILDRESNRMFRTARDFSEVRSPIELVEAQIRLLHGMLEDGAQNIREVEEVVRDSGHKLLELTAAAWRGSSVSGGA